MTVGQRHTHAEMIAAFSTYKAPNPFSGISHAALNVQDADNGSKVALAKMVTVNQETQGSVAHSTSSYH